MELSINKKSGGLATRGEMKIINASNGEFIRA